MSHKRLNKKIPVQTSGLPESPVENQQCGLAYCGKPAAGHGSHFDGPLCDAHLKRDSDQFKKSYFAHRKATIEEPMKILDKRIEVTRGALFELTSDRADVSDMFDDILERVQRCRKQVIDRLDSKIDAMETHLRAFEYFEKLKSEISKTENDGNLAASYELSKQMQLSLEDAPLKSVWIDPVDSSVEMVKKLQDSVEELSVDAEVVECQSVQNKISNGDSKFTYHNCFPVNAPAFISLWNHTEGFYYASNGLVKALQNGYQQLPKEILLSIAVNGQNWYYAYHNTSFTALCQFNVARNSAHLQIVSVQCVSHLQQMFIITSDNTLTVTDPIGTQLQTVALGSFNIGAACSMSHDMEKLYILGAGDIVSLSLDKFELQEKISLSEDAKDAYKLTKSGRNQILTSTSGIYRMSVVTKRIVPVWKSNAVGVQAAVEIGSGIFVVFCNLTGQVKILNSSGRVIKDINLPQLGVNYFQHCQGCNGNYGYNCNSISACALVTSSSCCVFLILSMQCGHQQKVIMSCM